MPEPQYEEVYPDSVIWGTYGGKYVNQIPANSLPFIKAKLPNQTIPVPDVPNPIVSNSGNLPLNTIAQDSDISNVTDDTVDQQVDVKAGLFNRDDIQGKMTGNNINLPAISISLRDSQQPQIGMISNRAKVHTLDLYRQDSEFTNAVAGLDNGIGAVTGGVAEPTDLSRVTGPVTISHDNPALEAASTPTPKAANNYTPIIFLVIFALVIWKFLF